MIKEMESIDLRYRSGNSVPIDRAWVPREEWEALKAALEETRKDAERYRWLCNGNGYFMEEEHLCGHGNDKAAADAAIDDCMKTWPGVDTPQ